MGSSSSKSSYGEQQSGPLRLDDVMDVPSFKAYYNRWRSQPGNRGRRMLVNAQHPISGTVQRAWLLELLEEKGMSPRMSIRWARYFLSEQQFATTDFVRFNNDMKHINLDPLEAKINPNLDNT